jgi:predicted nucleotidyltransferase
MRKSQAMLPLIESHRDDIAELCRRFGVQRMDVFGSAARVTDFDPARSDVDLLVTYLPGHVPNIVGYLALQDALTDLLRRRVDLVADKAIVNPYVRAGVEHSRQLLYAA